MSETASIDIVLPDVGEGIVEAQIVEWLAAPGEGVCEDQAIVVISTDKASVELPSPVSGVLREQVAQVGENVAVGAVLARVEASREAIAKFGFSGERSELRDPALSRPQATSGGEMPASDTMAQGRENPVAVPPAGSSIGSLAGETSSRRVPLSRNRLATARATEASWRNIPHIVEFRQIEVSQLERVRESYRERARRDRLRLTFLPFFVKAAAVALEKHPSFNAHLDMNAGEVVYHAHCDIGIAVATEDGLIVPVIHGVENLSVWQIAHKLNTLADGARRGVLSSRDIGSGTFTITNLGSYGTWLGTPLIRAPQVAIAGFGKIYSALLPGSSGPVTRPMLPLSMAADHRLHDGSHLAAFVDTIQELLSNPTAFVPMEGSE